MGRSAVGQRYITRIVELRRLSKARTEQCNELRREAGRCWAALVTAHRAARERGEWPCCRELELMVARGFALHSQTVQALAQRLDANVQTTKETRRQNVARAGETSILYPYKTPEYQTVIWKDMAIHMRDGVIELSNGRGRQSFKVRVPSELHDADVRRAELVWRADHFELCLILAVPDVAVAPELPQGALAGVDLGEVHIAAVVVTHGSALLVSGRGLRSCKRLRNKRHSRYRCVQAKMTQGSRRWRRLRRRSAQASALLFRQQRAILHQASHKMIAFCLLEGATDIAVGDVRAVQGKPRGKNNQKISQWTHGQLYRYLTEKAERAGLRIGLTPEDYSTVTCSACGSQCARAPRNRTLLCQRCGTRHHRDLNGAANICSRAQHGAYGSVQARAVSCQRPNSRRNAERFYSRT